MSEQVILQKALYTIKKLRHLLETRSEAPQPVAIVGLSCRFPQAAGKEAFWTLMASGRNVISRLPESRWELLQGTPERVLRDPSHPYWGGYLEEVGAFDPFFFGISPREAVRMDPQHRLLLEVAHETFEDAGMPTETLAGSNTGVFASLDISQLGHLQEMESELDALFLPTGNAISIAANRISYLFDLRGPSVILDSACSSSMTSLHLACLNLQSKACDMALVCAAKLNLLPYVNLVLARAKMLSPDGQCKTFDAQANGYVQGEGAGALLLKPLDRAVRDRDRIYAVILGGAVNQDGRTNGLTAPNGLQQEKLLRAAYTQAGINPHDISYVECHGTGTFLGDPIEIQALGNVLGHGRAQPCWIGSVKTNIGHLEPAAGIASVIKVALALQHQSIPPTLNFVTPNPHIPFEKYRLRVPRALELWPVYGQYRLAGISGFGFGGTNAHIVLREPMLGEKQAASIEKAYPTEVFTLSAKNSAALGLLVSRWYGLLAENPSITLAQTCHHLHRRASHHPQRLAILAATRDELLERLRELKDTGLEGAPSLKNVWLSSNQEDLRPVLPSDMEVLRNDPVLLAKAYVGKSKIPWAAYEADRCYPWMDLPRYPWQHRHYWPSLGRRWAALSGEVSDAYPLQARRVVSPLSTVQFEFRVSTDILPDIRDTFNVLHAGYYLEICAFAMQALLGRNEFSMEGTHFYSPLIVPDETVVTVQLTLESTADETFQFQVFSCMERQKNWVRHASGILKPEALPAAARDRVDAIQKRSTACLPGGQLYDKVLKMGLPAGDSIRWTHQLWIGAGEVLCELRQPATQRRNEEFRLGVHPGIVDGSIQPLFMLLPQHLVKPYIAAHVDALRFFRMHGGPLYLWVIVKALDEGGEKLVCDVCVITASGETVFEGEGVTLTQLDNRFGIQQFIQSSTQQAIDLTQIPETSRLPVVTDFLIEKVASLFSMQRTDVRTDVPLNEMGIDSLTSLVLMRTLETGLGFSTSMQDILQGPTIGALAAVIAGESGARAQSIPADAVSLRPEALSGSTNRWIAWRESRQQPQMRLFCFPYGGGGASIYREWQKYLPGTIEVCPVQLPGRENRMNETPIHDFSRMMQTLVEELHPELNLPFAFFGHSFGSLLAFELARHLREKGMPQPLHLFVSAFPDPRVPAKSLDRMLAQLHDQKLSLFDLDFKTLSALSQEEIRGLLDVFSANGIVDYSDANLDQEVIRMLLPVFVGDMSLVRTYEYRDMPPLALPITVFSGSRDTWVAPEDHKTWGEHTLADCRFHEFDSQHLFIREQPVRDAILNIISGVLSAHPEK